MELLIVWISWEDSLDAVVAAWGGGKQKTSPWRSVRHSQVCKAFTSQRYTSIL